MKAVILAGGFGTRISEESSSRPKPMIEIGGKPILWHIMKIYSHYGINDFIICAGYKSYFIKEYFANYYLHNSDIVFDVKSNSFEIHKNHSEPWKVTVVDTGENSMTGGRLKRVRQFLNSDDFCFTYGDGVADLDIGALIKFHKAHGRLATVTAVKPPGRFGALQLNGDSVENFIEKPQGDGSYINGGFFVLNPMVIDQIPNDLTIWEKEPMENLAKAGQMKAFFHDSFWQPMDTLRDKMHLENLILTKTAPWMKWK
jgi:glucose-1-phosphate cytidylyltransferase